MDLENPVVKLCLEGAEAEFQGRVEDARALYRRAWDAARDDYEACVAAHYVARRQESAEVAHRWNEEALRRAEAAGDERVRAFFPSLYVNLGHSHERLGHLAEAAHCYELAAELGLVHRPD
jgi:tetratricopeptide (TPR) repeat protein